MARIRNVKPELFDDPTICDLSAEAALVFIGLWTQADRAGRLVDEPRRLKIRLRPMSKCNMDAVLGELHDANLIIRYKVDDTALIQVKNFDKHQRPHHQEPPSVLPPISARFGESPKSSRDVGANPLEKETEKETETETETEMESVLMGTPSKPPTADALVMAWNTLTTAPISHVRELNADRRTKANARLRERPLSEWREVIVRIEESKFCRGENDRGWVADFDFLVKPGTATKALEGKYDNRVVHIRPTGKETLGAKAIRASNEFNADLERRTETARPALSPQRPQRQIAAGE